MQTGLGVAVAVQRGQAVFNAGAFLAPLVVRAATVWTGHLEVFGEGFRVGVVSLGQFVHPSVVEDGAWVVLRQLLSVFIKTLQVVEGGVVVHDVADFFLLVHAAERDLLLDDQTGQEVGRWHDRMEVGARGGLLVALGVVAAETCVDKAASGVDFHSATVATHDVVNTGVNVGTAQNHLSHLFAVSGRHTNGYGEFLGNLGRHTNLVHAEVGVG